MAKDETITVRLTSEIRDRMAKARNLRPPYVVSISDLVTRGIELACEELERHTKRSASDE